MSCDIEAVAADGPVFRLARQPDAWAWPDWAYAGPDGTFGNRYDDPRGEYRVLYASSQRLGAFLETLARFRPDPELAAVLSDIDGEEDEDADVVEPGVVGVEWLAGRALGRGSLRGDFAGVGHSRSLGHLARELGAAAAALGVGELDAAAIRQHAPRELTQRISRLVLECRVGDGGRQFGGVEYLSRLGDDLVNWAIYEPADPDASPLTETDSATIEPDDPDLAVAVERLGLTLAD